MRTCAACGLSEGFQLMVPIAEREKNSSSESYSSLLLRKMVYMLRTLLPRHTATRFRGGQSDQQWFIILSNCTGLKITHQLASNVINCMYWKCFLNGTSPYKTSFCPLQEQSSCRAEVSLQQETLYSCLNALSVSSNQVCIQIKMTDKDIKAQWHFYKPLILLWAVMHSGF